MDYIRTFASLSNRGVADGLEEGLSPSFPYWSLRDRRSWTIILRGDAGVSVISSAGLPLRGADKMHERNSPLRRASHDNRPITRTQRWRREEGLREAVFIEWPNAMRVNIYRNKATPQVAPQEGPESTASHAVTTQDITQVSAQVKSLLHAMGGEEDVSSMQSKLGIRQRRDFMRRYIVPAISAGLIERTIPDKPPSRFQKYRLTDKGRATLACTV